MAENHSTRRDLLKTAGVLGLGATLAGCGAEDGFAPNKPPVPGSANWLRGEERLMATSCGQCEAGCGLRVRVVEGRAVSVAGNDSCPVNRGGVGPRGLASPQLLYDPDRIRGPLLRTGPRGSGEWRELSWEEALEQLTERLGGLRAAETPERLGILCGRERGLVREVWQRFASAFGTPNLFDAGRSDDGAQIAAVRAMQGLDEVPAYDWEHARLVLSLGAGVLDASCQNLHFARIRGRQGEGLERARILHVGPALTRTAMNADEWISARPGTNGAFALGLAHVLVRDDLFDSDFVAEHALGFEPWTDAEGVEHAGFRALLEDYTPERVGVVCDVPAHKLETVARLMAQTRPCFAIDGADDLKASNGVQSAMAVHALNALLGSIDRPGGLLTQIAPPLAEWSEVELDQIAEAGLARESLFRHVGSIDLLPAALTAAGPEALDTLVIDHANPAYTRAHPAAWRTALAQVPFVVSCSPFMDETTAECADLVLPDDTWLERWGDSCAAPSLGRAVFGLRQPVVERLYDTRSTADVLIGLARELDEGVADALPWKDFRSALKQRLIGLYKAKSGSIVESKGSTFLKRLYAEGYWAADDYQHEQWERVLRTNSGRFEFFSTALWSELGEEAARQGLSRAQLAEQRAALGDPDLLCLPGYREAMTSGAAGRFPLLLLPYKPHTHARGSGANLPWLNDLAPWRGRATWTSEAELHPDTAALHGIEQGDTVTVESAEGTIELQAYLTAGVRTGCVRVALGAGHTAFGRFAEGWGANVMTLVSAEHPDPWGGSSALQGTRVAIRSNQS